MSHFIVNQHGIVINRTKASEGRIAIAAWDIGNPAKNHFVSAQHTTREGRVSLTEGKWELRRGSSDTALTLVLVDGVVIGRVNRRAAAMLAPLLDGDLVDVVILQNQEKEGRSTMAVHIYAKLGVSGNDQVVREPSTTEERRAYLALLACTMQALKAWSNEQMSNWDIGGEVSRLPQGMDSKAPSVLFGAEEWDFASGSIGNIVNPDLIDLMGSRCYAALKSSGAPTIEP